MDYTIGFSETYYLARNKDVREAVEDGVLKSGLQHFQLHGHDEGREFSPYFDTQYYLTNNPDVAQAVQAGYMSAYEHFINWGQSESRLPIAGYSETSYLLANRDVTDAVRSGALKSGWEHYVLHGRNEGRLGFETRQKVEYGTAEDDVIAANVYELVFAGKGNDVIGAGIVSSGDLNTTIDGFGFGNARVYGNEGADTFSFKAGVYPGTQLPTHFAKVIVADFDLSEGDKIRIEHAVYNADGELLSGAATYSDIQAMLQNQNGSAYINFSGGILLEGIAVADVTASMFEFV